MACGGTQAADAGNVTDIAGSDSDLPEPELACFVYLEGAQTFAFWGRNSALLLVRF